MENDYQMVNDTFEQMATFIDRIKATAVQCEKVEFQKWQCICFWNSVMNRGDATINK